MARRGRPTIEIGDIPAAAIANTAKGILVALALHERESWHDLLARLDKTVVQAVVDGSHHHRIASVAVSQLTPLCMGRPSRSACHLDTTNL